MYDKIHYKKKKSVWCFEHSLALPFFGVGMKTDIFEACGHCWVFQICSHIDAALPGANTRDPTHDKAIREKTWRARRISFSGVFEKASSRDPTHDKVTRRKPDRQGGSGFQGFQKAAPSSHLKDDICLSDACLNGLLPNFSDTGRRPSPISSQIRINLEL